MVSKRMQQAAAQLEQELTLPGDCPIVDMVEDERPSNIKHRLNIPGEVLDRIAHTLESGKSYKMRLRSLEVLSALRAHLRHRLLDMDLHCHVQKVDEEHVRVFVTKAEDIVRRAKRARS